MNLFNFMSKKNNLVKAEEFEQYLKKATQKQVEKYCDSITVGKEIDYTKQYWGHAVSDWTEGRVPEKIKGVFYMSAFNSRPLNVGDVLLIKMNSGKVGKNIILSLKRCSDPHDMHWVFVACIGYKE